MSEGGFKIAICGVGLMGGSLAMCFKEQPHLQVIGHSYNPKSIEKYKRFNVVDDATVSLQEAVSEADFVFLCVPVGKLEEYLQQLHQCKLKPGAIITDVGSTKASIVDCAKGFDWGHAYFIGGHPMAGSERSGVEAASKHLFENAFYILTPSENTPDEVYARLVKLLEATRAQIIRLDPLQHDEIVGAISHLPHIIAAALVNLVSELNTNADGNLYERLAAGGFRDITRIASSDPLIWRDILMNNRDVVLRLLDEWDKQIEHFRIQLEAENGPGIEHLFQQANTFRSQLPERKKGVILSTYDIYIDVPDHPGIIGQIATQLGLHYVNLSNIEIIESREEVPGVLRLSFRNEQDMDKAVKLLHEMSFTPRF